ncbi:FADL372Wp [Eremothecium gossypii FDAG1]|nr:FADL372Wp [Eremothecium gossypii FDAG1]
MSSTPVKDAAKQLVKTLEKFPAERIKHMQCFRDVQLSRFRRIAGLESAPKDTKKPSINDIKDILNRTSGPLGLRKDLLKKMANAMPQEHFTPTSIEQQRLALERILSNRYKTHYEVGDKLYKPAGKPQYYERLLAEVQGRSKESLLTAMRTVLFGK